MTTHAKFKKVVRRHAQETGQRYTQALTDLEGLETRLFHEPVAERLIAHLRDRYGIDAIAATQISQHNAHVFRIDRGDGDPWIARVFPPARARSAVDGDAAILRFLERQHYPAERPAVDAAVSELDGASVLVTRFVDGEPLPAGSAKLGMMGDLLGRLHALVPDDSVSRPGGAGGDDPSRAGSPRQDLLAALSFLDAVDTKVPPAHRERFEQLREQVRAADDGHDLPEALLHGNLLHDPDHALLTAQGPVAINWKSAGRGPRLADVAYLLWGAPWVAGDGIGAAVEAYRRHVTLTDAELDRLEAVMHVRPLYLVCFDYRRAVLQGQQPTGSEPWWGLIDSDHIRATATAARCAFRR
jgi:Ser/Thr protein kinase RdoA (MazF antagonist)